MTSVMVVWTNWVQLDICWPDFGDFKDSHLPHAHTNCNKIYRAYSVRELHMWTILLSNFVWYTNAIFFQMCKNLWTANYIMVHFKEYKIFETFFWYDGINTSVLRKEWYKNCCTKILIACFGLWVISSHLGFLT